MGSANSLVKSKRTKGQIITLTQRNKTEIEKLRQLVDTKGGDFLLSLATKPTLVYINKIPTVIKYDIDLLKDIAGSMSPSYYLEIEEIVKYIEQLVPKSKKF